MSCSGAFFSITSPCILALSSMSSSGESQPLTPLSCERLPVDIVGISITPHVYSREMRWRRVPSEEPGSLVRLFIAHRETSEQPLELKLTFNAGKSTWEAGSTFELTLEDGKTGISEDFHIPIELPGIQITSIVCLADKDSLPAPTDPTGWSVNRNTGELI